MNVPPSIQMLTPGRAHIIMGGLDYSFSVSQLHELLEVNPDELHLPTAGVIQRLHDT